LGISINTFHVHQEGLLDEDPSMTIRVTPAPKVHDRSILGELQGYPVDIEAVYHTLVNPITMTDPQKLEEKRILLNKQAYTLLCKSQPASGSRASHK
jgi:hypothetical protein